MANRISSRLLLMMLFSAFVLSACNKSEQTGRQEIDTLFRPVKPKQSGIRFVNKLTDTDSSNSIFYEYYYNGAGLAVGDINNDGLSDIFFGANMTKSRLYINKGRLKFEDITEEAEINTSGKWVTGVSLFDINQDGWLDIYVCVGGNIIDDYTNLLYINKGRKEDIAFTECAALVGLDDDSYSTQANLLDYDLDGDLDIYLVTSSMNIPNKNTIRLRRNDGSANNTDRLYRNDGIDPESGLPVFRNVSREAGIVWDGFGLGSCVCDINRDGWPDIYVCNDYVSNDLLYINQRNGTFRDLLKDYLKHTSYSTMGMDIADFNNDGLTDIFTLDMQPENYYRKRIMALNMREYRRYENEINAGYSHQYIRNILQMNNGEINGRYSFSDVGQLAGIYETDWSWAPLFADFDNDGFKDLFVGNGIHYDMTNMDFSELWTKTIKAHPDMEFKVLYQMLRNELEKKENIKKPNVIFRNSGNLLFDNKTIEWGLNHPLYSTGSAFSDLDNDGDLDLVLNNINDLASIFENTLIPDNELADKSRFLSVILNGDSLNNGGIGSKIFLFYGKNQQYYEHYPIRGFQSMVDPKIHFGVGEAALIDSLLIIWPDGKRQNIENIETGRVITLYHKEAYLNDTSPVLTNRSNKLFISTDRKAGIRYRHRERQFIDFYIQPLVPHQYSKEGPGIAVGDVNSDGLDDFFIGGSTSFSGAIFMQQKSGKFISSVFPGNNNYEDMGCLLFDADGDGDKDLYVVSGGSGLPPGNQFYTDRLYINNGKSDFTLHKNALPDERFCGSQVTASDFDRDGDLDLFVCGRVDLENYPIPPRSYLLRNDSKGSEVKFTDITGTTCSELERPGLIAAALWTDFNRDGWSDLVLAGEWMPVTFFKNDRGKFVNVTSETGLEEYTGWWNSLNAFDFDRDGDIDYVAGNLGLNTQYKVSLEQPMRIIAKDFDLDGTIDPVCSYFVQGKSYPIYHRNILLSQIPSLKNRFTTYDEYAKATMEDIFSETTLEDAYQRECRFFETAWIENMGDGTFHIHTLPLEAQFSPVFGILADDYDSDGNADILLTGNFYSSNVAEGQYDALIGLFLKGDGRGGFKPVPGKESGFFVDGDAKGMAELTTANGNTLILTAQNSDSLRVFSPAALTAKIIRLRDNDVSAVLKYKTGETDIREFYYGSGYLSQSSRICRVPEDVISVVVTDYLGKTRTINYEKE